MWRRVERVRVGQRKLWRMRLEWDKVGVERGRKIERVERGLEAEKVERQ